MTGAEEAITIEAVTAMLPDDIGGLFALVKEQMAEIDRLQEEIRLLHAPASGSKGDLPASPGPTSSIARDAAVGATALAIVATQDRSCPAAAEPDDAVTVLLPQDIYCDRLTLVKGLDIDAARLLAGLGVTRFADIAAFTPEDVSEIDSMLHSPGRVSKQCWIEQAAILAAGKSTLYSRQMESGATNLPSASSTAVTNAADKTTATSAKVIDLDSVRRKKITPAGHGAANRGRRLALIAASLLVAGSIAWQAAGPGWHEALQKVTAALM